MMFSPEQHFIWTFDKLVMLRDKPTPPNLLEASGILRKLLLDQKPLLTQACKGKKVKVRFPVLDIACDLENDPMINPGTIMLASMHGFAPELGTNWQYVRELKLDKFLAIKKTLVNGKFMSVRDLIDYVANVAGGVHFSEAIKDSQRTVEQSYKGWVVNDLPALLGDIHAITQSVVLGMAALYHHLISGESRDDAGGG